MPIVHDGDVVLFEVESRLLGTELELAAGNGAIAKAQTSFDEALKNIKPALSNVLEVLKDSQPHEIEIEFGLKIGGESTFVIAKGTTEVNFAIRLLWKQS
jgi:hypothetical protein